MQTLGLFTVGLAASCSQGGPPTPCGDGGEENHPTDGGTRDSDNANSMPDAFDIDKCRHEVRFTLDAVRSDKPGNAEAVQVVMEFTVENTTPSGCRSLRLEGLRFRFKTERLPVGQALIVKKGVNVPLAESSIDHEGMFRTTFMLDLAPGSKRTFQVMADSNLAGTGSKLTVVLEEMSYTTGLGGRPVVTTTDFGLPLEGHTYTYTKRNELPDR